MLQVLVDGAREAYENMQLDKEMLQRHEEFPAVRLYSFSSFCATIGIFTPREGLINEQLCMHKGIQIATRPSGGGLLFHEEDLSFCFYIPLTEMNCPPLTIGRTINACILDSLAPFLPKVDIDEEPRFRQSPFCFSSLTPFDLVWNNRKIGGCAQRRSKYGTLHQGTLFLKKPNWDIIASVILNPNDLHQMRSTIQPLDELVLENPTLQTLQDSILRTMCEFFGRKAQV